MLCLNSIRKHTTENQFIHHGITWLCYWAVISWALSNRHDLASTFKISSSIIIVQALVFYLNLNFLLPHLLEKKRFWAYFISVVGVIFTSYIVYQGFHLLFDIEPSHSSNNSKETLQKMHTGMTIVSSLAILFISTIYKTMHDARCREAERIELKNSQLESEMKFLKSQINPHFLFNALNNIYTLAQLQSPNTPEVILKLSDMMRYMLYESNTDFVCIEKELKYIENYISLHQLKEDGEMNITFDYSEANRAGQIAPLLILPFFENGFKHGNLENLEKGELKAVLKTSEDGIYFSIENTKSANAHTKDEVGGVGLVNVKRRLELLYPNRHDIVVTDQDDLFKIELTINKKTKKNVQNAYCRRRAAR